MGLNNVIYPDLKEQVSRTKESVKRMNKAIKDMKTTWT